MHSTEVPSNNTIAEGDNTSPALSKEGKQIIQQVMRILLYYARVVAPTLLVALSAITSQQASSPMQTTKEWVNQLIVPKEQNNLNQKHKAEWGHFLSIVKWEIPPNNWDTLNVAQIIKAVTSLAAESELGALFINAKEAVYETNIRKGDSQASVHTHPNRQFDGPAGVHQQ